MSDKYKYGFDEPWDAEKALEQRRELFAQAEDRIKNQPVNRQRTEPTSRPMRQTTPSAQPRRRQNEPSGRDTRSARPVSSARKANHTQQVRRPRKKKKANVKGWSILIAIGVASLALAIVFIVLIASIFSSDTDENVPETTPSTEEIEAMTQPQGKSTAEIIAAADRLAQSYDYDAAIAALHEYGTDWQLQPELASAESNYLDAKSALVRWEDTTTIPHLSFRALIVDADRAFDGDEDAMTYNQSMLTVGEFRSILQSLYDQDYVLINMRDMVKESENGEFSQGDIYLPSDKKPIVISQEDVNYYQYRVDGPDEDVLPDAEGDGFACKLLLDESGKLTNEYIDADGNVLYGAYDFVSIVEEFVEENPDFSYKGAKGILAVTGVEGVFGFRTHPDWESTLGEDAYMQEIRAAQEVSAALKDSGWEIACYGYSKISFGDSDANTIAANLKRWDNQVAPITGKSDILFYPYGVDIGTVDYYSGEKYEAVSNAGFRFFCNMDASEYWVQLRSGYMRQARRVIDGYRLEYGDDLFDDLFDVEEIIDNVRPRPVPSL